jgi:hypothetical protein
LEEQLFEECEAEMIEDEALEAVFTMYGDTNENKSNEEVVDEIKTDVDNADFPEEFIHESGLKAENFLSVADYYYGIPEMNLEKYLHIKDIDIDEDEKLEESLKLAEINAQINESMSSSINSDDEDEIIDHLELNSRVSFDTYVTAYEENVATREVGTQTDLSHLQQMQLSPQFVCFQDPESAEKFFEKTEHEFESSLLLLNEKISEAVQATPETATQSVQASPELAPKETTQQPIKGYRTTAFYGYNLPAKTQCPNNFARLDLPHKRCESLTDLTIDECKIHEENCKFEHDPKSIVCCHCKSPVKSVEKAKRKLSFNNNNNLQTTDSGVAGVSPPSVLPKLIRSASLLLRIQQYEEEIKRHTINALLKTPPKRPRKNSEA